MLLKYVFSALRLNGIFFRIRFFPRMPLIGKLYRKKYRQNDIFRLLHLKSNLQEKLGRELFGKHLTGVVFDTYNGVFVNNLQDVQINNVLGFAGAYNKQEVQYLQSLIKNDHQVYIVGAHIGTLLVPVSKVAKGVFAFEANPATFRHLERNIRLNNLSNTIAFNYAAYNKETELSFYNSKANSGSSKIKPAIDNYMYNYDQPDVIHVRARKLDDIVSENNLPLPNFLIMDIEGSEFFALQGAHACLENSEYLYIEFIPHHLSNVANIPVTYFIDTITRYFSRMMLVSEALQQPDKEYAGASLSEKLTSMYQNQMSADLLFYK